MENEVLEKLITAATCAATGMNAQRVNWLIYSDKGKIRKCAEITSDWMQSLQKTLTPSFLQRIVDQSLEMWQSGNDSICRNAPHLIVAYGSSSDCTIALTQLSIAAPALGVGTCWAGWVEIAASNFPAMQEFLDLPDGEVCQGAMMVGYQKYKYPRIPKRNEPNVAWR